MLRTLLVHSPAIPVVLGRALLEAVRLSGEEGVDGLFAYELVLSGAADLDLDGFIGREICCEIELDGSAPRQINALITDAALSGEEGRHVQYKLTLRPWLHLATLRTDCRIFQDKTVVEILDALLADYAFPVDKRLLETYPVRDYQMAQLDCVEAIRLWVFEGGAAEYGNSKKGQWHCITPTLVKGSKPTEAVLILAGEELVILNRAMARGALVKYPGPSKFEQGGRYRKVAQAFCEVGLRKPAGSKSPEDWAKDMQCTDPWVYPMDISISDEALTPKSCWSFSRPRGERGEVPDWDWLAANFMTQGYIEAKEVITGKKSVPVKG